MKNKLHLNANQNTLATMRNFQENKNEMKNDLVIRFDLNKNPLKPLHYSPKK